MKPWMIIAALALLLAGAVVFFFLWEPDDSDLAEGVELEAIEEMGTRSVTLYFGNSRADGYVRETRSIQTRLHRDEEVEAVLNELVAGPTGSGAVRTVPEGTVLRRAYYDEGQRLLYLDFSQELVSGLNGGSAMELVTLGALMRTLRADFPEIESVQILVEGLEVETLGGHVDLTRPLRAQEWM